MDTPFDQLKKWEEFHGIFSRFLFWAEQVFSSFFHCLPGKI